MAGRPGRWLSRQPAAAWTSRRPGA
jgi:hypothetical protein